LLKLLALEGMIVSIDAMVRHIVLNMLQNTKKTFKEMSIKRLQKKAGWGNSTLDMILMADF